MIFVLPNIRNSRLMSSLWSQITAKTGLTKTLSLTTKNAMTRRFFPSAAILPVISRTAVAVPRCDAPKPFLYKNNGSKGQLLCKICDSQFSPDESRFSSLKLRCPHCSNTLVPKKNRKHFILHKCVNPKCPYYLHNLKKVDEQDLKLDYGKNKYKLHYIYRKFQIDFFHMDLNILPKNVSSLISKHN